MKLIAKSSEEFKFNWLFHTYFQTNVRKTSVIGLENSMRVDKVSGTTSQFSNQEFSATEFTDSIFQLSKQGPVSIKSPEKTIALEFKNAPDVVIWNPFKTMPDLDSFDNFLCVEVGNVSKPITLSPHTEFLMEQTIKLK